ncbi:MAG TPA: tetratricopeptide repeat protein [Pyrinomonadaceae bacterium]
MKRPFGRRVRWFGFATAMVLLTTRIFAVGLAQSSDEDRQRALHLLWEEAKAGAALPLLEKLAKERPNDGLISFSYGFALVAKVRLLKNAAERKQTRIEARKWLSKAADLGINDPVLKSLLEAIPPDGGNDEVFSAVQAADEAMRDGEELYVKGSFLEAAKAYERALQADPKLYEAALYAGDMYFKGGQNVKAAEWFARAVQVNPDRETAYRYSATPFLRDGKLDDAKTRYIDAVIAEPYNRLTWSGLSQWASAAGIQLGHPRIDIPTSVKSGGGNNINITIDPKVDEDSSGNGAWMMYGLHRAQWKISEFAKAYPNEKAYRHSLREEVTALQGVVEAVKQRQKEKKIAELNPSLANLVKLSDEGLLEAYVLFAMADQGIAQDYALYRKDNREKLRRYLIEYVTARQ